jgi:digalactosyldiacylglycerol synthase
MERKDRARQEDTSQEMLSVSQEDASHPHRPPKLPSVSNMAPTTSKTASYAELDTMMEHMIPSLGHFPRSDASIAFALNELDTLLSEEEEDDDGPGSSEEDSRTLFLGPDTGIAVAEEARPSTGDASAEKKLVSHRIDFTQEYPKIAIVTTAALPWLTGTAVNPALRAAYLWERGHDVVLLVPWVPPKDQKKIFLNPSDRFSRPEAQQVEIQRHIEKRVPFTIRWGSRGEGNGVGSNAQEAKGSFDSEFDDNQKMNELRVVFYAGKYSPALGSIIPTQDIQPLVPRDAACIVLEEPEHLTWYHSGCRWIRAFDRYVPVVGVMHTNYVDYARRMAGEAASITLKRLNKFLCRQHTHTCIKLSDAVQKLPREQVCFVHGVADGFLNVGRCGKEIHFTKGAYFIGKALWAKGFEELLDRMQEHVALAGDVECMDVYGHGHELDAIKKEADARGLPITFWGPKDHLSEDMISYRVFVNPSTSDVVATTSAEALAMGKWLLVPRHPCNAFFESFRNCLIYENAQQFSDLLVHAASTNPYPLDAAEIERLTWSSATDRFLFCCSDTNVERSKRLGLKRVVNRTSWMGYNVGYGVYSIVSKAMDSVTKSVQLNM